VSDEEFFGTVERVLSLGLNTNSYKFALLRALARWGRGSHQGSLISRQWLAERFLEFYWPLANQFRIRQSTNTTREPVAWKWCREAAIDLGLSSATTIDDYRMKYSAHFASLVGRLASRGGCLDEVLPRFHVLPRGRRPPKSLFQLDQEAVPRLCEGVPRFLRTHAGVLEALSLGAWVRFTEQYSPEAQPRSALTKTLRSVSERA